MCCAIACLIKFILHIVVSVLMVLGFILTIIGALLLWGFNVIMKGISPIQSQISQFLSKLGIHGNTDDVMNMIATNSSVIGSVTLALGITLIVIAIAMSVIMCCCSTRLILMMITALLIALTIGLIIFVAYYGTDATNRLFIPFEKFVKREMIEKYEGISSMNAKSIIINVIQITVKCCGLSNYRDFDSSKSFNRTMTIGEGKVVEIPFPISCCNYESDFTISKQEMNNCLHEQASDRKEKGCWTLIKPQLESFFKKCFATMGITIAVLIGVIMGLIFMILCMDKVP